MNGIVMIIPPRRKTSRGIQGSGLGLAIIKEIAENHGGDIPSIRGFMERKVVSRKFTCIYGWSKEKQYTKAL